MALAHATTSPRAPYESLAEQIDRPAITALKWQTAPGFGSYAAATEVSKVDTVPITVASPRVIPTLAAFERERIREASVLQPLQSWEGVVLDVREDSFLVRLVDATGDHADEELELGKEDLSEFDLSLLQPGAIFYWTIGYRQQVPRGGRERVSRIRFRRLPAWSQRELTAARERAVTLSNELDW
jgi:hypothetical protein